MTLNKKGIFVLTAAAMGFGFYAPADAAVIAKWGFETVTPADSTNSAANGPHLPDFGLGTADALHASALTDWSTPVGNGSANSWSSNEWAIGDYYQFNVSTVGFSGITLLVDHTRSSTGPATFQVQYSTDGATFIDAPGAAYAPDPAASFSSGLEKPWTPPRYGFDFSSISELNNQPSLTLRLTATAAPTSTGGTSRVDNVTIGTDPIPEPTTFALATLAAAGLALRRRRM